MNKRVRRLNKVKEYKGDALAKFIAVLIFNDLEMIQLVCSNRNLDKAGRELDLNEEQVQYEFGSNGKGLACAYEVYLWTILEENGLEEAIKFFKDTAVKSFYENRE